MRVGASKRKKGKKAKQTKTKYTANEEINHMKIIIYFIYG